MAKLALLVALIALGVAVAAYQKASGPEEIQRKIEAVRRETADSLGRVRQETADGLSRMEKALRPDDTQKPKR